jgi:hypothetical protein
MNPFGPSPDTKTLLEEDNIVSLRTAFVLDDGDLVEFRLMPVDLESLTPKERNWWAPKDFDWVSRDCTWLYRHIRSAVEEAKLMSGLSCVEKNVKPITFEKPPEFKLLWTDSGHSVALFMNGLPWAFIHEETHQGYSKGVLDPSSKKYWNEELFEKTFLK